MSVMMLKNNKTTVLAAAPARGCCALLLAAPLFLLFLLRECLVAHGRAGARGCALHVQLGGLELAGQHAWVGVVHLKILPPQHAVQLGHILHAGHRQIWGKLFQPFNGIYSPSSRCLHGQ